MDELSSDTRILKDRDYYCDQCERKSMKIIEADDKNVKLMCRNCGFTRVCTKGFYSR